MSREQCVKTFCNAGVLNVAVDLHETCVLTLAASYCKCIQQLLLSDNTCLLAQLGPAEQAVSFARPPTSDAASRVCLLIE